MKPKSISATSLESYEQCPKRFAADLAKRFYTSPEGPSSFGTAIHDTLDLYIMKLYEGTEPGENAEHDLNLLLGLWEAGSHHHLGFGSDYYGEGREMLTRWVDTRTLPVEVLSREAKETFDLEIPGWDGARQTYTYICDRIDRTRAGAVEVIDYKTQWEMVGPHKMRNLIQPNMYALAMRKKYEVDEVEVTYDMLRYEPVTAIFSAKDMDAFEQYLLRATDRMWQDENPREYVNKNCVWCPRKAVCSALKKATEVGYTPTLPLDDLAARRVEAKSAHKALEQLIEEIDGTMLAAMREYDLDVLDLDGATVKFGQRSRVKYSAEAALRVLGDDALPFMTVGKTALEKEFKRKGSRFTDAQRAELEDLAIKSYDEPSVTVTQKGPTAT